MFTATHLRTGAVALGIVASSCAQAQVIRLKNVGAGSGQEIPLKANSSVAIDTAGNLVAECALTAAGVCPGLQAAPAVGAPTATLSRIDGDPSITAGETIRLAWSSSGNVCQATSTGPAPTGFTGARPEAFPSGELVALPVAGSFSFALTCYNAAGASTASTISLTVGSGSGPSQETQPAECDILTADPLVNPANFAAVEKTWTQVFSAPDGDPLVVYPNGYGFTSIAGASKGTYVVVPFVANAGQTVNLYWDQAQAQPNQGYSVSRPADGMFFGISPCKRDVRAPKFGDADVYLRGGCRKWSNAASLIWSTEFAATDDSGCKVTAGKTYFLHIMAADPAGGLQAGEHSCAETPNSAQGCDVQVKLSK